MIKLSGLMLGLVFSSSLALAAESVQGAYTLINPQDINWGEAPAAFPDGAQLAVLQGDPSEAGPLTIRMKFPAGYMISEHSHSAPEAITLISGGAELSFGTSFDPSNLQKLNVGGFLLLPGNTYHSLRTTAPSIVQISTQGPFDIHYVDAKAPH